MFGSVYFFFCFFVVVVVVEVICLGGLPGNRGIETYQMVIFYFVSQVLRGRLKL